MSAFASPPVFKQYGLLNILSFKQAVDFHAREMLMETGEICECACEREKRSGIRQQCNQRVFMFTRASDSGKAVRPVRFGQKKGHEKYVHIFFVTGKSGSQVETIKPHIKDIRKQKG
jgi:hypothetical protein